MGKWRGTMKKLQLNKKTVKNLAVKTDLKAGRDTNPPTVVLPPGAEPTQFTFCVGQCNGGILIA